MKRLILLFLTIASLNSCTTNYYLVSAEPIEVYSSHEFTGSPYIIPIGSMFKVNGKKKRNKYYTLWYNNTKGYAYASPIENSLTRSRRSTSGSSSYSGEAGGTVHVKGYTRKDGTYVRPHTRRAPRR